MAPFAPAPDLLAEFVRQQEQIRLLWNLAEDSGDLDDRQAAEAASLNLGILARDILGETGGSPAYRAAQQSLSQLWRQADYTETGADLKAAEKAADDLGEAAIAAVEDLLNQGQKLAPTLS